MIAAHDIGNFETIREACKDGNLALLESRDKATGEYRCLICAMGTDQGTSDILPVPLAVMVWNDPYENYVDPTLDTLPIAKTPTVPNALEMDGLERLVDKVGLFQVLVALDVLCSDKAAHIRANWQDMRAARDWDNASKRVLSCAISKAVANVSP